MGQSELIEDPGLDIITWDKKDPAPTSRLVTTGKLKLPESKLTRVNLGLLEISQRDELFALATSLRIDLFALLERAKDGKLTRTELRESGLFESLKRKEGFNPISSKQKVQLDALLAILASPKFADKPIEIPGVKFNLFQKSDGGFYSEKIKLPSGEVISEGIQFNYSGKIVAVVGGELTDTQGTISHPEKIKFRKADKLFQLVRRDRSLFAVEIQENSDTKVKAISPKQLQPSNTELDNRTVTRVERQVSELNDQAMHRTIQRELTEANPEKASQIETRKTTIQDIGRYHSGLTGSIFGFDSIKENPSRSYIDGVRLLERATGSRATEILTSDNPSELLLTDQQSTKQELEKVLQNLGVATNKAIKRNVKASQAFDPFELHIDPFLATGPHDAPDKTPFKLPRGVGVLTHFEWAPSPNSRKFKSLRFVFHNDFNLDARNLRLEYESIFGPGIAVTLNKNKDKDGFTEVVLAWPESFLRFGKRIKGTLISGEISNFFPFEVTANIDVVWGDRLRRDFESKSAKTGFTSLAENLSTIKKLAPESLHQYLFTGEVSSAEVKQKLKPLSGLSPMLGENVRAVIAKETKDIIRSMTASNVVPEVETELFISLVKEHLGEAFKQIALESKHRRGAVVGVKGGLTWHGPGWIVEPILTINDQVGEQIELTRKKIGSPVSKLQEANLHTRDGGFILDLSPNESSSIVIRTSKDIGLGRVSKNEFQLVGPVSKIRESIEILPSGRKQLSLWLVGTEDKTDIAYRRISRDNLPDIESLVLSEGSVQSDGVSLSKTSSPHIESEIFVNTPTPIRYFRRHLYSTPFQWLQGRVTRRKPHSHFISNERSYDK